MRCCRSNSSRGEGGSACRDVIESFKVIYFNSRSNCWYKVWSIEGDLHVIDTFDSVDDSTELGIDNVVDVAFCSCFRSCNHCTKSAWQFWHLLCRHLFDIRFRQRAYHQIKLHCNAMLLVCRTSLLLFGSGSDHSHWCVVTWHFRHNFSVGEIVRRHREHVWDDDEEEEEEVAGQRCRNLQDSPRKHLSNMCVLYIYMYIYISTCVRTPWLFHKRSILMMMTFW